jgi:hypothetical protein
MSAGVFLPVNGSQVMSGTLPLAQMLGSCWPKRLFMVLVEPSQLVNRLTTAWRLFCQASRARTWSMAQPWLP